MSSNKLPISFFFLNPKRNVYLIGLCYSVYTFLHFRKNNLNKQKSLLLKSKKVTFCLSETLGWIPFALVNSSHPSYLHELPVPALSFLCLGVSKSHILENFFKSSTVIPGHSRMVGKRVCWSRVESGSTVRRKKIRVVHGEAATGSILLSVVLN